MTEANINFKLEHFFFYYYYTDFPKKRISFSGSWEKYIKIYLKKHNLSMGSQTDEIRKSFEGFPYFKNELMNNLEFFLIHSQAPNYT